MGGVPAMAFPSYNYVNNLAIAKLLPSLSVCIVALYQSEIVKYCYYSH
jgi:hypothetical protein